MANPQQRTGVTAEPAVVPFPAEVDIGNAQRLGSALGEALTSAATVIADLTATTYCDCSGARVLLLAYERAAAAGIGLRLVVPSASVLRLITLAGGGPLPPVYPTVKAALDSSR